MCTVKWIAANCAAVKQKASPLPRWSPVPTFLERNARSHVQAEPPSMSPHAAHHTRHAARADLSTSQQQPSAHTRGTKPPRSRSVQSSRLRGHSNAHMRLRHTHTPDDGLAFTQQRFHTPSHTVTNRSHFMSTCNEHETHSRPHQTPPHAHTTPASEHTLRSKASPATHHSHHTFKSFIVTHAHCCLLHTHIPHLKPPG